MAWYGEIFQKFFNYIEWVVKMFLKYNSSKTKKSYIPGVSGRSTFGRLMLTISLSVCTLLLIQNSLVMAQNEYVPIEAVIQFDCAYAQHVENNKYKITIENEDASAPMPKNDTVEVNESGEGSFAITITEPGTYDYLVYQIEGDDDSITYDNTVYEVHVAVINDDKGELIYTVAVNIANTDQKPEKLSFRNITANINIDPEEPSEDSTEEKEKGTTETETEEATEATTEKGEEVTTETKTEGEVTTEAQTEKTTEGTAVKPNEESATNKEPAPQKADVEPGETPKKSSNSILTGDDAEIVLAIIVLMVSLMGIIFIVGKKHREDDM